MKSIIFPLFVVAFFAIVGVADAKMGDVLWSINGTAVTNGQTIIGIETDDVNFFAVTVTNIIAASKLTNALDWIANSTQVGDGSGIITSAPLMQRSQGLLWVTFDIGFVAGFDTMSGNLVSSVLLSQFATTGLNTNQPLLNYRDKIIIILQASPQNPSVIAIDVTQRSQPKLLWQWQPVNSGSMIASIILSSTAGVVVVSITMPNEHLVGLNVVTGAATFRYNPKYFPATFGGCIASPTTALVYCAGSSMFIDALDVSAKANGTLKWQAKSSGTWTTGFGSLLLGGQTNDQYLFAPRMTMDANNALVFQALDTRTGARVFNSSELVSFGIFGGDFPVIPTKRPSLLIVPINFVSGPSAIFFVNATTGATIQWMTFPTSPPTDGFFINPASWSGNSMIIATTGGTLAAIALI